MKKRLLIAVCVLLTLLLTACTRTHAAGGSSHPYSWKSTGSGSLRVTVENAPEAGWSWVAEGAESGGLTVTAAETAADGSAVFDITAQGTVGGAVRLACRRDTAPYDDAFLINLILTTSDKGKLTVADTSYTDLPPAASAGEDGKPSALCYTNEDGSLSVFLDADTALWSWTALDYDAARLAAELSLGEDGCTYKLSGLTSGETDLLLYDTAQDYGFRFALTVADDLTVSVTSCEAGTFEIFPEELPGMDEVTKLVGTLKFPDTVRVLSAEAVSWYGASENDCADLTVSSQEARYDLLVTKTYTVDDLVSLCYGSGGGVSVTQLAVGDYWGVLCTTQASLTIFWNDGDGRAYVLTPFPGENVTQETLRLTAEALCTA